jgi:hypothetical protein
MDHYIVHCSSGPTTKTAHQPNAQLQMVLGLGTLHLLCIEMMWHQVIESNTQIGTRVASGLVSNLDGDLEVES